MSHILKLSLRSLAAHRARLALTGLTIVLGVGFVVASFVLGDSLRSAFGGLTTEIVAGTDLQVRPLDEFGQVGTVTDAELTQIRDTDGVRSAQPFIDGDRVQAVDGAGNVIEPNGPPQFGYAWVPDTALSSFSIVDGRAPQAGEMVIDVDTAAAGDFIVGERYGVISPQGSFEFTHVGTASFGANNDTLGAQFLLFDLPDAAAVTGQEAGVYEEIVVSVEADQVASDVQARIEAFLPAGVEVINQQTLQDETAADFNQNVRTLEYILTAFAIIALFVSTFIIYNTFGMLLAQRVRELGLLRAIGAEAGQLRTGVVFEALIVGLVASIIGLAAGIGLKVGVEALFDLLGFALPDGGTVIGIRTIIAAFVLGVGVTLISAIVPARRAAKVAPVTAMGGHATEVKESARLRLIVGGIALAISIAVGAFGLFAADGVAVGLSALGVGILGIFLSVALLSPIIAPAVVSVVGWPLKKAFGVSGQLATGNAKRNPRRTATTAAALMVGLALVTTALVVGESLKAELRTTLDETVQADYVVNSGDFEEIPTAVTTDLNALPELDDVMQVGYEDIRIDGADNELVGVTIATVADLVNLSMTDGTVPVDGGPNVLVGVDNAVDNGWAPGDTITLDFEDGQALDVTVAGIYDESWVFEGATLVDYAVVDELTDIAGPSWIAAGLSNGSSGDQAEAAFVGIVEKYPQLTIQSDVEYREWVEGQIDQLLSVINAMLALAIFIALIGIGLTLALSVFERTRELGLLRAVGMTRRQLRRMIRWEAALVAMFGSVLGVGVGLLFGWAAATALPDTITTVVAVPATRIGILVAVSVVAGLIAALLPARRAGNLNVLDAIAAT